jgi:amidohydrolase
MSAGTAPTAPEGLEEAKARAARAVRDARDEILELSHRIHAAPEPAFEERASAAACAEVLRRHGFAVELPAGRLETAIRATLTGAARASNDEQPLGRVGVLAEYDALPGLGHGCGHNTMAASGVGAAIALAQIRDAWAGEVVFLGCPAEERGSGKQFMLDDGLFGGLDAALLFHPNDRAASRIALLAAEDVEVTFTGLQAHAASEPWEGRNALDALVLLFSSIGLWRQQLRPEARVHGIVIEGGTAANIIPSRAVGRFMLRSYDRDYQAELRRRFEDLARGAALQTGTTADVVFSGGSTTMHANEPLRERWVANASALGVPDGPLDLDHVGSSDMGNVSWRLPAIHPYLAICDEGVPGHSTEFRDAAATPRADEATLTAATLVAQTALDVLADPDLRAAMWQAFGEG